MPWLAASICAIVAWVAALKAAAVAPATAADPTGRTDSWGCGCAGALA